MNRITPASPARKAPALDLGECHHGSSGVIGQAPLDFIRWATAKYGVACGDAFVLIPASQQRLAQEWGRSASTVQYYVKQLGPAVIQSDPLIVARSILQMDQTTNAEVPSRGSREHGLAVAREPLAEAAASVSRWPARLAGAVAISGRALHEVHEVHGWMDGEESNSSTPNGMAPVSSLRTERLSTDREVDEGLALLVELCRQWHLPDTIDPPGYGWLGRLTVGELDRLARATCRRMRQFDGTKDRVRNPLGWAIGRIRGGDEQWWAAGADEPPAALDPARPLSGEVQGPGRPAEPDAAVSVVVPTPEAAARLRQEIDELAATLSVDGERAGGTAMAEGVGAWS